MPEVASLIRQHIHALEPYQPILPFEVLSQQLGFACDEIIKLDANENPYGPIPEVLEALSNLPYPHIYPDPESRLLRCALAKYTKVPAKNLFAGAGIDELIDLIMRLFLEEGEVLLNCPPTFGMYAFDAAIQNAKVVSVPRRSDFSLDLDAIERAAEENRPKLLFLASPNNPDGSLVCDEELEYILTLPLVVVLDEAYIEFAGPEKSRLRQAPVRDNLIVLRTFSKWAALAGLRVGFGAFPSSLMPHLWKIKQPYNVSVAASAGALATLKHIDHLEKAAHKVRDERARLHRRLEEISYLDPYPSQANFILCRVVDRDARDLKQTLAKNGILVRHFDKPNLKDHIRISVGKPEHTDALIAALAEWE